MKGKKIVPQAVGMALGMIGVWSLGEFGGVIVPNEIALAIGTVLSVVVSVVVPDEMEA